MRRRTGDHAYNYLKKLQDVEFHYIEAVCNQGIKILGYKPHCKRGDVRKHLPIAEEITAAGVVTADSLTGKEKIIRRARLSVIDDILVRPVVFPENTEEDKRIA